MTMTTPAVDVERVELSPAAALFRSLGDPTRLMVVRRLTAGPTRRGRRLEPAPGLTLAGLAARPAN